MYWILNLNKFKGMGFFYVITMTVMVDNFRYIWVFLSFLLTGGWDLQITTVVRSPRRKHWFYVIYDILWKSLCSYGFGQADTLTRFFGHWCLLNNFCFGHISHRAEFLFGDGDMMRRMSTIEIRQLWVAVNKTGGILRGAHEQRRSSTVYPCGDGPKLKIVTPMAM